tara:strand:- start:43 stop:579 length:537 start_codon:yes stop_codon:yes gene_type:complete
MSTGYSDFEQITQYVDVGGLSDDAIVFDSDPVVVATNGGIGINSLTYHSHIVHDASQPNIIGQVIRRPHGPKVATGEVVLANFTVPANQTAGSQYTFLRKSDLEAGGSAENALDLEIPNGQSVVLKLTTVASQDANSEGSFTLEIYRFPAESRAWNADDSSLALADAVTVSNAFVKPA